MKKYLIGINDSSDFAKNIAPFGKVLKELDTMGKLYVHDSTKIYTQHIEIIYFRNEDNFQKRYLSTEKFDETYGFRFDVRRYFPGVDPDYRISDLETFIARIEALENLLTVLDDKADEPVEKPIVDHDGNRLEDGYAYCYHECKRCHRKIFVKMNCFCAYEKPDGWVTHDEDRETEATFCPICEKELLKQQEKLYIQFMRGE